MICDSHVHTNLSMDSNGDIDLTIKEAIKKRMKYLTITDHHDFEYENDTFLQDPFKYYDIINSYKEKYKDAIELLIGIEIGIESRFFKELETFVNSVPFDFVIGSSHVVNGEDPYYEHYWIDNSEEHNMNKYFLSILENVTNFNNYDVYGHLDYAIRYAPSKDDNYSYEKYSHVIDNILNAIIQSGRGIEINTGGLRKNLRSTNPHEDIIKRYVQLGGNIITIGSDAHSPSDIGKDFDVARKILIAAGINQYCIFKKRRPVFIDL